MGWGQTHWKRVLRKWVLIFLALFTDGFGSNWGLGSQIHVETVLRKRVLIFSTVFAVGLGPGGWDGVKPIGKGC